METKTKKENDGKVAINTFPRWKWWNNSSSKIKVRIWTA